jgi:hypothetical protein
MGLGFQTSAKPVRSFLRSKPDRPKTLAGIAKAAKDFVAQEAWLARISNIQTEENWLTVSLHPVAGDVLFAWEDDGRVVASAKTSITGPGFHAKALDLMDFIHARTGLAWDWTNADLTGYRTNADFHQLQTRMADHARRLMFTLSTQPQADGASLSIHLDPELPVCDLPNHVLTPMGPASIKQVNSLINPDDDQAMAYATNIYPWWEKGITPQVVRNTAVSLMWTDIPWRPPEDDEEREVMHLVKDCLEYAQSQPHALPIPTHEFHELTQALNTPANTPFPEPRPDGIGYRRKICTWQLGSGWTLQLPGHWHADITDTGQATVFKYRDKQVFCTRLDMTPKPGATPQSILAEGIDFTSTPDSRTARFTCDHLAGIVTIGPDPEHHGRVHATAKVADIDGLLIFSVFYGDRNDLQWLTNMLTSIKHPR